MEQGEVRLNSHPTDRSVVGAKLHRRVSQQFFEVAFWILGFGALAGLLLGRAPKAVAQATTDANSVRVAVSAASQHMVAMTEAMGEPSQGVIRGTETVWAVFDSPQAAVNAAADQVRVKLAAQGLVPTAWVFDPQCKFDQPRPVISAEGIKIPLRWQVAWTAATVRINR